MVFYFIYNLVFGVGDNVLNFLSELVENFVLVIKLWYL